MGEFFPRLPELECFMVQERAPPLRPARSERDWMDKTSERFAYRCTPLSIANASGWELLCPFEFSAAWNGGERPEDVVVQPANPADPMPRLAGGHFGHGVLTFHTGYLFRTSPGWALTARGCPNTYKPGITALEGLVETDWLPFQFTMNWRFTHPGMVRFEKDEPFAFLAIVPHAILDEVQPRLRHLNDEPGLRESYDSWCRSRADFNNRIAARDADAMTEGWQRHYLKGEDVSGKIEPIFHIAKRKLRAPEKK